MTEAKKEFVYTWTIENYPHCLQKKREYLNSPTFLLSDKSEWYVSLCPRGSKTSKRNYIGCFLLREDKSSEVITVRFKLELLNDKSVPLLLRTVDRKDFIASDGGYGFPNFESINVIYGSRRTEFLPNDTLTVRCRICKIVGSFPEAGQCLARTHIKTETLAFLWCIKDFSAESSTSQEIVVKSTSNPRRKLSFNLMKDGLSEELIGIQLTVDNNKTRQFLVCEFDLLGHSEAKVISSKNEIRIDPEIKNKRWEVSSFDPEALTEKRDSYLQNDTLNIQCRVVISSGVETASIIKYVYEYGMQNQQGVLTIHGDDKREVETSAPNDLNHDLLLMYQEGTLCDVTLQTETESFAAHSNILCARSPVFHKMFTVDMKEKTTKNVHIDDLDADTVRQFLIYIYNDSIENLDLESAKKLYFAGDKYLVFSLRKKCSKFIMTKLSESNVCEVLILADQHQDEPFKNSVIEFIWQHMEVVLKTEEWQSLMKSNNPLTSEIMYKKLMLG